MRNLLTVFAFLLSIGFKASAQAEKDDQVITRTIFGKEKKAIIAERVHLSVQEQEAFWPLYDEYECKIKAIGEARLKLIDRYASGYKTFNNESAADMAKAYLDNIEGYNELYKVYLEKFKRSIGGVRAAAVIQLEIYIETAIQANLLQQIPMISNMLE